MSFETFSDLSLAVLYLVVAGYVVARVRQIAGRMMFAPIALGTFFTLRALSRLADPHGVELWSSQPLLAALDALSIIALGVVLLSLGPIVRAMAANDDAARWSAAEYARAQRHYTQVVRHRLINPVTAIKGSALTLRDVPTLDDAARLQLLDAILEGCDQLEAVSLVPERRDDVERDLDAVPRIPERRRGSTPDRAPGPS